MSTPAPTLSPSLARSIRSVAAYRARASGAPEATWPAVDRLESDPEALAEYRAGWAEGLAWRAASPVAAALADHPVTCMDCRQECGRSAVSGSTGLCDPCLERR